MVPTEVPTEAHIQECVHDKRTAFPLLDYSKLSVRMSPASQLDAISRFGVWCGDPRLAQSCMRDADYVATFMGYLS